MVSFIDAHRAEHGVEPICKVLPIAPSTYYDHLSKRADPGRRSARVRRDAVLRPEIRRVFEENWQVYGVRKVWRQLGREGITVARCTVARLMKDMGLQGIIRGKPHRTTVPDKKAPCPLDKVNRQFRVPAPNMLWVGDFTYVATWKGFAYVASVIDAYARRIVGWSVSTSAHAGFVLDALEQAVHERRPARGMGLVHHSDRGSQGGLNRSSQHSVEGGCDGKRQAKIRTLHESGAPLTRASWCCASGRAAPVLGTDRGRTLERRRGGRGWGITAGRNEVVSRGRRYAPITFGTLRRKAVGTVSVFRGARGDRIDAGPGLQCAAHGATSEPRSIDDLA